jgi:hypothetical protein
MVIFHLLRWSIPLALFVFTIWEISQYIQNPNKDKKAKRRFRIGLVINVIVLISLLQDIIFPHLL